MQIDRRIAVAAMVGLVSGGTDPVSAQTAAPGSGSRDFDFFFGRWQVRHRRLKERLAGSREWIEFDGTSVAQPLLGGHGNVDDNVFAFDGNTIRGVTLRSFDPATGQWSIGTSTPGRRSGRSIRRCAGAFATASARSTPTTPSPAGRSGCASPGRR